MWEAGEAGSRDTHPRRPTTNNLLTDYNPSARARPRPESLGQEKTSTTLVNPVRNRILPRYYRVIDVQIILMSEPRYLDVLRT